MTFDTVLNALSHRYLQTMHKFERKTGFSKATFTGWEWRCHLLTLQNRYKVVPVCVSHIVSRSFTHLSPACKLSKGMRVFSVLTMVLIL